MYFFDIIEIVGFLFIMFGRFVVIVVDVSEYSEKVFDCEY